jgi:hypothetical protein
MASVGGRKVGRVVVVGFRCGGEAFVKGKCRGEVTRNAEATPLQPHYIANTQCGTRRCQVTASRRKHSPQVFAGPAAASHGPARGVAKPHRGDPGGPAGGIGASRRAVNLGFGGASDLGILICINAHARRLANP